MRRQLQSVEQTIQRHSDKATTTIRRGYLVYAYDGSTAQVSVTLTDPRTETRGAVFRALIRPGLIINPLAVGTPVSVQFRHGKAEIIA